MLTGGTGYLGHAIALEAACDNHQVVALVRSLNSPFIPAHPNIRLIKGDITDTASIDAAVDGCDAIIHCAAMAKLWTRQRDLMYEVNVAGTRNILQSALEHRVRKVVFTSSCSVLGPSAKSMVDETTPRINSMTTDYEISKHMAEELCRQYHRRGLHTVIVLPPAIYGPGKGTDSNAVSRIIIQCMRTGLMFQPSPSTFCRNFAFVDDVARGHLLALQSGISGERYILGGENISYREFSRSIRKALKRKLTVIPLTHALLQAAAGLNQLRLSIMKSDSNFVPSTIAQVFQDRRFSSQKAIDQLGYAITPFASGIEQTITHINQQI